MQHSHLQALATEIFNAKNNLEPGITKELLIPKIRRYDLRNNNFRGDKKSLTVLALYYCPSYIQKNETHHPKR